MTRNIKTRPVEKPLYGNYLKKAKENAALAKEAAAKCAWNAAAVSAVHAVISGADAFCVFHLGKRCASERHEDATALLKTCACDGKR